MTGQNVRNIMSQTDTEGNSVRKTVTTHLGFITSCYCDKLTPLLCYIVPSPFLCILNKKKGPKYVRRNDTWPAQPGALISYQLSVGSFDEVHIRAASAEGI